LCTSLSEGDISDKHQSLFQEILPRLSPRLGVELIQKKIAAALKE
jgi:hypothetical protein